MNMTAYETKNKTDDTPLGSIHAVNGPLTMCGMVIPCNGKWVLSMGMATCSRCIKEERVMAGSREKAVEYERFEQDSQKYNDHHAMTYRTAL